MLVYNWLLKWSHVMDKIEEWMVRTTDKWIGTDEWMNDEWREGVGE